MPDSWAEFNFLVQLVSFRLSRFVGLSCSFAWLLPIGAYSVIFSPMYAVSIDSSGLNSPSHLLGSSIDFRLYEPDCHFAQVVYVSRAKDLRVKPDELIKSLAFSREKSLRITAAVAGAIRFPVILSNGNLALRHPKAVFPVRNCYSPVLEAYKQHFQEDTAIRVGVECLRRRSLQFLRLRDNSVVYRTVEAFYLRLLSILSP